MRTTSFLRAAFSFNGRLARRPFWIAFSINTVLLKGLTYLLALMWTPVFLSYDSQSINLAGIILTTIFGILILANHLSLACRRFHDTGRSFAQYIALHAIRIASTYFLSFLGRLGGIDLPHILAIIINAAIFVVVIVLLCERTDYENETFGPATPNSNTGADASEKTSVPVTEPVRTNNAQF